MIAKVSSFSMLTVMKKLTFVVCPRITFSSQRAQIMSDDCLRGGNSLAGNGGVKSFALSVHPWRLSVTMPTKMLAAAFFCV